MTKATPVDMLEVVAVWHPSVE